MITVDYRDGSKELLKPLLKLGLDAEIGTLEFGDVAFEGRGAEGSSVDVGVEYKKLGELITCMRDGRYSGHQLPGMSVYDYRILLIEEGLTQPDVEGYICIMGFDHKTRTRKWVRHPSNMLLSEYEKHLFTYMWCGGVTVLRSKDLQGSAKMLFFLYRWWTDQALDDHTSHLQQHKPASVLPLSAQRIALMAWPGVGRQVSRAALDRFRTVRAAANAPLHEWAELSTVDKRGGLRKFGVSKATQLERFLQTEE
jgi:ERCC4-type nuclease